MSTLPASRTEIEQAVRIARAYAADQLPWFAPTLFAARLVMTSGCPALAAVDDGLRVYFNPDLVGDLMAHTEPRRSMVELAWVWVHEISHVLREHGQRATERHAEAEPWNVAADLEINDAEWEGLQPPTHWPPLLPEHYGLPTGKLAEFYYQHLPKAWREQLAQADSARAGSALCDEGSGVHGQVRPWEADASSPDSPAISTLEQESLRQGVAVAIHDQKSRGDIPGGWRRWAEHVMKPRVNWREVLRRRMRGAIVTALGGRWDYSFQRPHRRSGVYSPLLRPSLNGQLVPRIACIVDTSGSINQNDLSHALAEVRTVLESMRTPITVIPCDAVAYAPVRVLTQSDFLQLGQHLRGGGGTNMIAGIEAALALTRPPDVVIVLTDGYTPYPRRPYTTPVIFGILNPAGSPCVPAPPMPPWHSRDVIVIQDA